MSFQKLVIMLIFCSLLQKTKKSSVLITLNSNHQSLFKLVVISNVKIYFLSCHMIERFCLVKSGMSKGFPSCQCSYLHYQDGWSLAEGSL